MVFSFRSLSIPSVLVLSLLASFRPALVFGAKKSPCAGALSSAAAASGELSPQVTEQGVTYTPIAHSNADIGIGWRGRDGTIWYPATVKKFPKLKTTVEGVDYESTNNPRSDAQNYCEKLGMKIPTLMEWFNLGFSMGAKKQPSIGGWLYDQYDFTAQIFPEALLKGYFFIQDDAEHAIQGASTLRNPRYRPSDTYVLCVEDEELFTDRIGARVSTDYQQIEHNWTKVSHPNLTGWKAPNGAEWYETDVFGDRQKAAQFCKERGLELPSLDDWKSLGVYLGAQYSVNEPFRSRYTPQVLSALGKKGAYGQGPAQFWATDGVFDGNSGEAKPWDWNQSGTSRYAICIKKP